MQSALPTILISIHSLVKRETVRGVGVALWLENFNPLPRKEGDLQAAKSYIAREDFNPLPRKEGDQVRRWRNRNASDFNPLPRKEGDRLPEADGERKRTFQSTPS